MRGLPNFRPTKDLKSVHQNILIPRRFLQIDMTDWNTSDRLLKIFLPKNRRDSVSTCEESEEGRFVSLYHGEAFLISFHTPPILLH